MRQKTINLYQFDELSDGAKEKAREWWREQIDANDFDAVIDDAVRMGELLGIEFRTHSVKLMGGGYRDDVNVWWSGFSSQGDGACFEGRYEYKKGAVKAILAETGAGGPDASGGDRELLRIAQALQNVQRGAFYSLVATMTHSGHYSHSGCMGVDVSNAYNGDQEEELTQLMRDFADWIYSQLDQENDYLMSDENADESIRINEYEFTEEGERA